ncbi:MAG: Gar1/Naf1 family protein [Nitrososphaerales archaeon]|nr:Gar1/Naf1 family protein [Nitrososphaerales archaeon]
MMNSLLQVGVILHQAKSGRLIVLLSREVKPGTSILDNKGKKLGRIVELIGPVRSPYASVSVATSRLGKDGDPAFVE